VNSRTHRFTPSQRRFGSSSSLAVPSARSRYGLSFCRSSSPNRSLSRIITRWMAGETHGGHASLPPLPLRTKLPQFQMQPSPVEASWLPVSSVALRNFLKRSGSIVGFCGVDIVPSRACGLLFCEAG
jgi:hypothetical protein